MRFLANENFPVPSIRQLREAGYDIAAVIEDNRGCDDKTVMSRAVAEERIIITFDRDYGELIYRLGLSPPQVLFICATALEVRLSQLSN